MMTTSYTDMTAAAQGFKGVLLDAYGVFWGGGATGLLPGSPELMEKLVSDGKVVGILSNSTQLAAVEDAKFQKNGLIPGKHYQFIVTSGEVTRHVLLNEELPFPTPRKKYCLFGTPHPRFFSHEAIFKDSKFEITTDLTEADFLFTSIPHIAGEDQTDPELFLEEVKSMIATGLPLVCANPDRFAHEGNPPRPVVRQGSIAAMYEQLGGKVYYFGKPYERAYAMAMKHFEQHGIKVPSDVLMVGDTPETDIRGGRNYGMSTALLVKQGIMHHRIELEGDKAIESLPETDRPDFTVDHFVL